MKDYFTLHRTNNTYTCTRALCVMLYRKNARVACTCVIREMLVKYSYYTMVLHVDKLFIKPTLFHELKKTPILFR